MEHPEDESYYVTAQRPRIHQGKYFLIFEVISGEELTNHFPPFAKSLKGCSNIT